ncbi:hypothetical protein BD410DRAFT_788656 [Rickenella mellea]|uniref:C2H2-type domain-containing protein n=1 Tax=Rickenella mellea TaxID=50990 RepID=A0A4Y7Q518_9AGAM|nr:hypothetical protein BD410DRAFT_788656 [Rickenella mellea]
MSSLYLAIDEPFTGFQLTRGCPATRPSPSPNHAQEYDLSGSQYNATGISTWTFNPSQIGHKRDQPTIITHTSPAPTMTIPNPQQIPSFQHRADTLAPADVDTSLSSGGESPESQRSSRPTRPKTHACWMCHKSFDRPSTLRKHLLVHTGEKAFACDICGRRFGVASNLNRHTRRCALRPVNARNAITASDATDALSDQPTTTDSDSAAPRGSSQISRHTQSPNLSTASSDHREQPSKPKRRRRAPSPSRWIPESLRDFDLSPCKKEAPMPLPAVRPQEAVINGVVYIVEERDSFERNISSHPYHPDGWSGKLPGPAPPPSDVTNKRGVHFNYECVF